MAELISILLWSIGFLWAFWGMYVLVMGIYRAPRMGWRRVERVIDLVFSPLERDHCKKSHESDINRAIKLLESLGSKHG